MAELTGCEGVLALLKQIYEVLQEYDQQTDAMINAELEVLQQSLLAREREAADESDGAVGEKAS